MVQTPHLARLAARGVMFEAQCTLKAEQARLLRAWARATSPLEQYRWPITPEMHFLDLPPVEYRA